MKRFAFKMLVQIERADTVNGIELLNSCGDDPNYAKKVLRNLVADGYVRIANARETLPNAALSLTEKGRNAISAETHQRRTELLQWLSIAVTFIVAVIGLFLKNG